MKIRRIVLKEIRYRKGSFILGLISVTAAIGCLTGAQILLRAHTLRAQALREQAETHTLQEMAGLNDDIESAMRNLGFNIAILPKDQNLGDYFAEDYASKLMPEACLDRLRQSELSAIEQPLAVLRQRVKWPEKNRTIILVGTGTGTDGRTIEVKDPSVDPIPPGSISLGYELHQGLGLKAGDRVQLMGRTFTVHKCYEQLGVKDDITVWVNLRDAQEMLGKQGWINEIRAVKRPGAKTPLATVRSEIAQILPGTQVMENTPKTLTQTLAGAQAPKTRESASLLERETNTRLADNRRRFSSILSGLVLVFAMVWVGLLAFGNVRTRREEIGALRTIGFRSRHIMYLFLYRSVVMGIAGGILGFLAGAFFAAYFAHSDSVNVSVGFPASQPRLMGVALLIAVCTTAAASLIPSLLAARQDPASILGQR